MLWELMLRKKGCRCGNRLVFCTIIRQFRMAGQAVECDGLAYESVRTSVSAVRTLTSGERHRQVQTANKTAGLKDRAEKTVSDGWQSGRMRRS